MPAIKAAAAAFAAALVLSACGGGGSDSKHTPPGGPEISQANVGWPKFGYDAEQSRFSPLRSVDRATVGRLGVAWSFAPRDTAIWESYPIVVGTTMYVSTNPGQVIALDATTGERRWTFTPRVDFLLAAEAGVGAPTSRGVTVAGGHVYLMTYDNRLIALDATDGRAQWERQVADPSDGTVTTSPPTYSDGRLFVGSSGSDAEGVRGYVVAYDARSGRRLWHVWTVPAHMGGGRVWMPPTADASGDTVYAGTGNPSPALTATGRHGCEDWVSGMIALDASTGQLKWGAHEVCGDVWDYDGGQPPLLYDTQAGGRTVAAVGHANKSGTYWIRDAATGRALAPPRPLIPQTTPRPRPTRAGTHVCPGALGGIPYGPAAHDPSSRTVFQPAVELCMTYKVGDRSGTGARVQLGGGTARVVPGTPARGTIVALDDATAQVRWRRELPAPMVGGALATAGGLVFSGADDGYLYAFDTHDGSTVWRGHVGLPFGTAPLTYSVDGVQYVAIVAGGSTVTEVTGTRPGARLVVLRLGGRPLR